MNTNDSLHREQLPEPKTVAYVRGFLGLMVVLSAWFAGMLFLVGIFTGPHILLGAVVFGIFSTAANMLRNRLLIRTPSSRWLTIGMAVVCICISAYSCWEMFRASAAFPAFVAPALLAMSYASVMVVLGRSDVAAWYKSNTPG